MPSYEVIKPCYTPFGNGKLRYRAAGKFVTLSAEEAESLEGFVRLAGDETVRIPDTTTATAEAEDAVRIPDTSEPEEDGEVTQDAGEPYAGDE